MKALTLLQPWASLVGLGVKTMLDMSWPCPPSLIGQALAIHAGTKRPPLERVGGWVVGWGADGHTDGMVEVDGDRHVNLPLGAVVATCRVAACVPICEENEDAGPDYAVRLDLLGGAWHGGRNVTDQLPYGDFTPGRYAWLLEDVKPTTERCPVCWLIPSRAVDERTGMRYVDDGYGNPFPCTWCDGRGHGCPPVPARDRQRVWNREA